MGTCHQLEDSRILYNLLDVSVLLTNKTNKLIGDTEPTQMFEKKSNNQTHKLSGKWNIDNCSTYFCICTQGSHLGQSSCQTRTLWCTQDRIPSEGEVDRNRCYNPCNPSNSRVHSNYGIPSYQGNGRAVLEQ